MLETLEERRLLAVGPTPIEPPAEVAGATSGVNEAPFISQVQLSGLFEGLSTSLTGAYRDQNATDTHTIAVNWGDPNDPASSTFTVSPFDSLRVGDTFQSTTDDAVLEITSLHPLDHEVRFRTEHRYLDDGPAPGNGTSTDYSRLDFTVTDDGGLAARSQHSVPIWNVRPTLVLNGVEEQNEAAVLTGSLSDPGLLDEHEVVIHWDDPTDSADSTFTIPAVGSLSGGDTFDSGTDGPMLSITNVIPVAGSLSVGDTFRSSTDDAVLSITNVDASSGEIGFRVGHAYGSGGTSAISVTVADDDLGVDSEQIQYHRNSAPAIMQMQPSGMFEGLSTFTGVYRDVDAMDSHTIEVDFDDPNDPGIATFSVSSIDALSVGDTFQSTSDGSLLEIAALDPLNNEVRFTIEHIYLDDGPAPGNGTSTDYSRLDFTVTDDGGLAARRQHSVPIWNLAPTMALNPVATIGESETAVLTGTITDRGLLDAHELIIDWDDHSELVDSTFAISATALLSEGDTISSTSDDAVLTITGVDLSKGEFNIHVEHTYLNDGVSTISATVSDDDLGASAADVDVLVNNVGPTVELLSGTDVIREGDAYTASGSFSDPGMLDRHKMTVDWDDPNSVSSFFELPATTNLTVDDTFDSTTDGAILTIIGIDGEEVSFSASHRYLDDGPAPGNGTPHDDVAITVTVEDADAGIDSSDVRVAIQNVDPVIHDVSVIDLGSRSDRALPGDKVSISGLFSDLGVLDSHSVIVDWGASADSGDPLDASDSSDPLDASISVVSGSFNATHTYDTGGIFTITVTVTDDDTGQAVDSSLGLFVSGVRLDPNTGVLQIVGTSGKDDVKVEFKKGTDGGKGNGSDGEKDKAKRKGSDGAPDGPHIKVTVKLNKGKHSDGPDRHYFDPADVASINIVLGDGDDKATVGNGTDGGTVGALDIPTLILGEGGNDQLKGGPGSDTIFGGDGRDKIDGRDGDDNLFGGSGDDDLKGGQGNDLLSAGDGNDKLEDKQGMDLLIGGLGGDDIKSKGSGGGRNAGGDILVAGSSVYDDDPDALRTILNDAWITRFSAGDKYDDIVDDLVESLLTPGTHVFDDGAKDTVAGSNKLRDAFFADFDDLDKDDDKVKGDKDDRVIELNQLLGP
jgi:hypothetical protein